MAEEAASDGTLKETGDGLAGPPRRSRTGIFPMANDPAIGKPV